MQRGIRLLLNEKVRQDVKLELGAETQTIEVQADASALNYETAEQKGGIAPETVGELPLLVAGNARSAAGFVILLPGVTSPTGSVLDTHINGGQQGGGEGMLDGVSLVDPSGGNGIWSSYFDFIQSPDMVSELKVLTANYEPQYGSTGGAVVIMETKSGGNKFHGTLFEHHRNTALNARQFGVDFKPVDLENDFGGNISGPAKLPWLTTNKNKTYFFFNHERFRRRGALTRPTLSIPSLKQRAGDFTDWVDASGNLIPIFDPTTTRIEDGQVVRDQFMGCNGTTPNVICPDRIQNSLAKEWFRFLPNPTSPGPLNNYVPDEVPSSYAGDADFYNFRIDEYIGDNDHFSFTGYHRNNPISETSTLPPQISNNGTSYYKAWLLRLNWDHTFSPTVLNHFSGGYNDLYFFGEGSVAAPYADELPKIPGVFRNAYPPTITFSDGFETFGHPPGFIEENRWPAPVYVFNDLVTWVKGKHTFKFGGEYRNAANTFVFARGEAGTFNFASGQTGLLGINSGNPLASFLLEQVDSASVEVRKFPLASARWDAWIAHAGDTWKVTPKLSLTLGLRWEMHRPTAEKHDVFSFFDPIGANPGAGGRPGRLTFAGTRWGAASFGKRRSEETFTKGFAPRLGIAYSPIPKTVVRTGYGIFYDAMYYPGWQGGIGGNEGFNSIASLSSSLGGLAPAMILREGFPLDRFPQPPFLDPTFLNGQNAPIYRPFDANRLPYSQQWNLSIEREFTQNLTIGVNYVGSKATRLVSYLAALNALDPKLLSLGSQLYDEFQPGQTSLHGVPIPYDGWVEQMTGCPPSIAQALLPYPQYCSDIHGINENAGSSIYHSFQVKAEHRFSQGFWLLGSYTLAKLLTNADNVQPDQFGGSPAYTISPFERQRAKSLAVQDVPQTLAVSLIYDLPFGRGKRWLSTGGVANAILGGWRVSSVFRTNSGIPFLFRSGSCTVPDQFRVSCIPAVLPGADPFAQDKDSFSPDRPLLNASAFEPVDSFNFYHGAGARVSNLRGFGYYNHDLAVFKNIQIKEGWALQLRGEFFNAWNWHSLRDFDTDLASPSFGSWTGGVSDPRNIQVGAKLTF